MIQLVFYIELPIKDHSRLGLFFYRDFGCILKNSYKVPDWDVKKVWTTTLSFRGKEGRSTVERFFFSASVYIAFAVENSFHRRPMLWSVSLIYIEEHLYWHFSSIKFCYPQQFMFQMLEVFLYSLEARWFQHLVSICVQFPGQLFRQSTALTSIRAYSGPCDRWYQFFVQAWFVINLAQPVSFNITMYMIVSTSFLFLLVFIH